MSDAYRQKGRFDGPGPRGRTGPPPNRQPAVTRPTPCELTTNLYRYTGANLILHAYNVTFLPEVHRNDSFAKLMRLLEANSFSQIFAYDGLALLVSASMFPDMTLTAPMRGGEQIVKIEYKNTYDMSDPNVDRSMLVQCLEVLTRFHQKKNFWVDRRKMVSPSSQPFDLVPGLELIPGLTSTIRFTSHGFYLNIDMVYAVFYRSVPLLSLIEDILSRRGGRYDSATAPAAGNQFYEDFERFLRNVRLVTTHRERNATVRVSGILNKPASSVEFEVDGTKQTVAEYFAKTYAPLRNPNLPLVVVKKKDMVIYIPMEVLSVAPMQKYMRKLDEAGTSAMIKIAAQRPAERFRSITEKAKELAALQNPEIKGFGLAFDSSMATCKGIMLPPPVISFANSAEARVNNGSWNLRDVKAVSAESVAEWKVFLFGDRSRMSPHDLDAFCSLAKSYGVNFPQKPQIETVRSIKDFYDAAKAPFNLVVLPDKNAQRYEEVKRISETYAGVYTQCMVASNLAKLSNPSFVSNLLLKINSKLGGCNWVLGTKLFSDAPTLLIGIDVSHPGIGDLESPSIVSVVGSTDYNFVSYKTVIFQQERRIEIVSDELKSATRTLLRAHYQSTRTKPARIIIFRDGVGDSMFDAVFNSEVEVIRAACSELEAKYSPQINFIVAQKRHSIRFCAGRDNPQPGTVVDGLGVPPSTAGASAISSNNPVCDFYLVSHNALQGTARPVRYLVLLNESRFTTEVLHSSLYSLCHLYMRATKSVSVVPPIYYAHLGAARGKCYFERNSEGAIVMRKCMPKIDKSLYYL